MHIIESGPAAGVVGAQALARKIGLGKLVTFDMGGTTAKASIVEDGEVSRATEYQVGGGIMHGSRLLTGAGYLLRVPAIDLAEVGAGGGSLVWIDPGGALQVGPAERRRVAGSALLRPRRHRADGHRRQRDPRLPEPAPARGRRREAQRRARARGLRASGSRGRSGLPLAEAAYGAHVIAASNMMRAIRAVSSERGRDPREYALFAFGGNGPLFAAGMARAARDAAHRGAARARASSRRSGCSSPTSSTTTSGPGGAWCAASHRAELDEVFGRMEAEARAQLAAEGFTARRDPAPPARPTAATRASPSS